MEVKELILNKVNTTNWGRTCDYLQNIAYKVLSKKSLERYSQKSYEDYEVCEGLDGTLLNGQYFDWREFDTRARDIVSAWLDYFNEKELEKILKAI